MPADHPAHALNRILLAQKEKLQQRIRAGFARFGEEVQATVLQAAQKPKGLSRLLKKLDIAPPFDFERQLHELNRFLLQQGPAAFLAQVHQADRPDASTSGQRQSPKPASVPERAINRVSEPTTESLFDENGRYIGPERRSGMERRSGQDRRAQLDAVMKNQRFGGDRRQAVRRRADQDPDGADA